MARADNYVGFADSKVAPGGLIGLGIRLSHRLVRYADFRSPPNLGVVE